MRETLNRQRFSLSLPFDAIRDQSVLVVGCGNIGSHTTLALAQLGWQSFVLVDPDDVGDENLAVQHYDNTFLGWPKVEALKAQIRRINPHASVTGYKQKYTKNSPMAGAFFQLVVVATDNIESRRELYDSYTRRTWAEPGPLLIDARMLFEQCEVNFVRLTRDGELEQKYREAMNDTDFQQAPCGQASTNYTGRMAAAMIASQARRAVTGNTFPFTAIMDCGSLELMSVWREGEKYEPETYGDAPTRE